MACLEFLSHVFESQRHLHRKRCGPRRLLFSTLIRHFTAGWGRQSMERRGLLAACALIMTALGGLASFFTDDQSFVPGCVLDLILFPALSDLSVVLMQTNKTRSPDFSSISLHFYYHFDNSFGSFFQAAPIVCARCALCIESGIPNEVSQAISCDLFCQHL